MQIAKEWTVEPKEGWLKIEREHKRGDSRYMYARQKQAGLRGLGRQHARSELFEVLDGSFHDSARRLAGSTFGQSSQCASPGLADFGGWMALDARTARILEKERPRTDHSTKN